MDKRCIAICDSGIGGLRLLKMATERYPGEDFVYLGDFENLPYGDKSEEEIISIARNCYDKLVHFCPKLIIFACNTLSTVALNHLKGLGVPVIGVLPAVRTGRGLLLCTRATARSGYVKELKRQNKKLFVREMVGLAEKIEKYYEKGAEVDICNDFGSGWDYVSLGCTHYPLIYSKFLKIFKGTPIISGEGAVLRQIEKFVTTANPKGKEGLTCFIGKESQKLERIFKNLLFFNDFKNF